MARRDIGDILPGVAIAISLVPPLAVVGVDGGRRRLERIAGGDGPVPPPTCSRSSWSGPCCSARCASATAAPWIPGFHSRPVYSVVAIAGVLVVAALAVGHVPHGAALELE